MNRRSWFAALLGLGTANAQSVYDSTRAYIKPQWSSTCPQVNGECPVCGTMAPAYISGEVCDFVHPETCGPNDVLGFVPNPKEIDLIDPFRRVDCANCNATFLMRAENAEKKQ